MIDVTGDSAGDASCACICMTFHLSVSIHRFLLYRLLRNADWVTHSTTTTSPAEVMFLLTEGSFMLVWFAPVPSSAIVLQVNDTSRPSAAHDL